MNVPRYLLYGQASEGPVDWFVNVEALDKRCRERGWVIAPHSHPGFAQIMLVMSGRGVIDIEGVQYPFQSPCGLILPVNTIHGLAYEQGTDGWVITVADYFVRQLGVRMSSLAELLTRPAVVDLDKLPGSAGRMRSRVDCVSRELHHKPDGFDVMVESDLMAVLVELQRATRKTAHPVSAQTSRQSQVLTEFRSLVDAHFRQHFKIPDYAKRLNVSPFQLRAACEAIMNQSPKEMIEERLLSEAKRELIFSTRTVEDIGYRLGFADPSYFTRFFKKHTHTAPTSFRQAFKLGTPEAQEKVQV